MKRKVWGMISMTITIDDFFNYSDEYTVSHKIMDVKGRINFNQKHIWINPCFNEETITYVHEIMHHHYDFLNRENLPESRIEEMANDFYKNHRLLCEKIVMSKLYPVDKLDMDGWD